MTKKFILLILTGVFAFAGAGLRADASSASSGADPLELTLDGGYSETLDGWEEDGYPAMADFALAVRPSDFLSASLAAETMGYAHEAAEWDSSDEIVLQVAVPEEGLYRFFLDYYPLDADFQDYELSVTVNGELPYAEAEQIILYKYWNAGTAFSTDRYGNDFYSSQSVVAEWRNQAFWDPMGFYADPLSFHLEAGANTIVLTRKKGSFLVGDFTVTGLSESLSYADYLGEGTLLASPVLQTVEAETPLEKSSSSVQAGVCRDLGVTPFEVSILKLNILSGSSWSEERDTVTYSVSVPESGWYELTFKVRQSEVNNAAVFRTLRINGTVPFAEAVSLKIPYSTRWQDYTPSDAEGNPYLFYLDAGENTLSLSVDLSVYLETYETVQTILTTVNQLSLDITKLTGDQIDENRDWNITDYLPTIESDLLVMADALAAEADYLAGLYGADRASEAESDLKLCVRHLEYLAEKPDEIPKNIELLATSTSSVASLLGAVEALLVYSPLDMDRIYVHTDVALPEANAGFFARAWLSIRRFFLSFFEARYSEDASEGELEVWVNRSKQYVDLIQKLADEDFTAETGISVKVSVMSSESKLILAKSAGQNPDVALGIASWMPYDMGIRGALYDLSSFRDEEGFAETLSVFGTESLVPMVYDGGLYGLPDTENFYVLFYRTDILETLGLEVPETWQEVTEMMPVLKRYGMNFYIPLSSSSSLKAFDTTLPFLFQYGSTVYSADAFSTAIDDSASIAALTMMTELYTIYSMDVTVTSFYNDFILGKCPIGVGDFGMYVLLSNAAPSVQGLWSIAMMPGVDDGDGTVDRSAPGAATANVIFENTDQPEESWAFLQWWASTDTQVEFENLLLSTMGRSYMWNSGNQEAFALAGYPDEDLEVILGQWEWLKELPKVPGSYQVELEISNLWNKVVLDRENLRVDLNDAVIRADKEIRKKMSEFGYMDKYGNILKPYVLTSRSLIESWMEGGGG